MSSPRLDPIHAVALGAALTLPDGREHRPDIGCPCDPIAYRDLIEADQIVWIHGAPNTSGTGVVVRKESARHPTATDRGVPSLSRPESNSHGLATQGYPHTRTRPSPAGRLDFWWVGLPTIFFWIAGHAHLGFVALVGRTSLMGSKSTVAPTVKPRKWRLNAIKGDAT